MHEAKRTRFKAGRPLRRRACPGAPGSLRAFEANSARTKRTHRKTHKVRWTKGLRKMSIARKAKQSHRKPTIASAPTAHSLQSKASPPSFLRFRRFGFSAFLRFRRCHTMTLREKTVLAKRTHLTPLLQKHKHRRCDPQYRFAQQTHRRPVSTPGRQPPLALQDRLDAAAGLAGTKIACLQWEAPWGHRRETPTIGWRWFRLTLRPNTHGCWG